VSFLKHNLGLKLLALGLAVALWTFVQREDAVLQAVSVRLDVRNAPADMVATPAVQQVMVNLTGPRSYVSRISPEKVVAFVDAYQRRPGRYKADVKVEIPANLRAFVTARAAVDTVSVTVEERTRKSVAVVPEWDSPPPEGMAWRTPVVEPRMVSVTGAASAIEDVARAVVRLPSGGSVISDRFLLMAVDERGKPVGDVTLEPAEVNVYAELGRASVKRQAYVLPQTRGRPAAGIEVVSLTSEPQTVMLVGPSGSVSQATTVPTKPVDISGLAASADRPVAVVAPQGVTAFPPRVTVHIELRRAP
jgi:YbbR domain-containing protein